MDNNKTQIAILRGYGYFNGHIIKAEIVKILENENKAIIRYNENEISFDLINGFESNKLQYSGYQLDINSIEITPILDLTDYTTYELGKV